MLDQQDRAAGSNIHTPYGGVILDVHTNVHAQTALVQNSEMWHWWVVVRRVRRTKTDGEEKGWQTKFLKTKQIPQKRLKKADACDIVVWRVACHQLLCVADWGNSTDILKKEGEKMLTRRTKLSIAIICLPSCTSSFFNLLSFLPFLSLVHL